MQTANRMAFKEWAVICAALATGRQTIILRKGGIHEGPRGFQIDYPEFWLLSTNFHQGPEALSCEARPLWEQVRRDSGTADRLPIQHYAVVEQAFALHDERQLERLASHHVWSADTVRQRFHYRQPGLTAIVVRVYRVPQVFEVVNSARLAGCRSWTELPQELPTQGAVAVLDDAEFERRHRAVRDDLETPDEQDRAVDK